MKHAYLLAALFAAAAVQANPTVETNGILTNRDGRTLYTFDKDNANKSNCSGGCLAAWPAFTVANASLAGGDFSVVVRDDGTQQWAFQGKPLYFFSGDASPASSTATAGRRLALPTHRKGCAEQLLNSSGDYGYRIDATPSVQSRPAFGAAPRPSALIS
jgi:predicted lipoprotein with Yx(FWY)xxD motif